MKTQLYVHIPFCIRKCDYCDFLSGPANVTTRENYVASLIEEIKNSCYREQIDLVTTVFVGGGTPSCLEPDQIARIMDAIENSYPLSPDAEVSMECNPGTITAEGLRIYRKSGINRLSLGLQSANNGELARLGRIHTYEEFLNSYAMARAAGFDNINVDLMNALPGQTLASYEETLRKVAALMPDHLSAYSLIIEEGTPFYQRYQQDALVKARGEHTTQIPDEEQDQQMYELTDAFLSQAGYHRYEISNYAKPEKECQHNIGYWTRENYLGFGLGASSLMDNLRFQNTSDLTEYLAGEPGCRFPSRQSLTLAEQKQEFFFLGLRMTQGISLRSYHQLYGGDLLQDYPEEITKHTAEGLLEISGDRMKLTQQGLWLSDYVMEGFM